MTRGLFGIYYLCLIAGSFTLITDTPFLLNLAAVVTGAIFCAGLTLAWLIQRSVHERGRPGQFSIGSVLFFMTFVAVYLGTIRWLMNIANASGGSRFGEPTFLSLSILCLIPAVLASPVILAMADGLIWLAVWIVKRPSVQGWLARRREREGED